jgi:hypothetical protein
MRLALRLGYANVDSMLAEMSSHEWTEWLAFLRIEPLPDERADMYAAQSAWAAVAPHCKEPPDRAAFVLKFDDGANDQEAKDMILAQQLARFKVSP